MSRTLEPNARTVIGQLRTLAPADDDHPGRDWEFYLRMRSLAAMVANGFLFGGVFLVTLLLVNARIG